MIEVIHRFLSNRSVFGYTCAHTHMECEFDVFIFYFRMQVRFWTTLTFNVHTCYVSIQMNVSIANHLNTENAWYFAQTVNNTNMYLVMVRENQNYASHECMCGRESPDGAAVPPKCVFDRLSGRTDRINYQIRQDRLGIIDQDHRCECPCFSRDLRYQGCDVKFSEEWVRFVEQPRFVRFISVPHVYSHRCRSVTYPACVLAKMSCCRYTDTLMTQ